MPPVEKKELVLAQNQYAFIQDETKGLIKVHVGPITFTPSGNDRPVKYDPFGKKFVTANTLEEAMQQNPTAPEGSYIILENPANNGTNPPSGQSLPPTDLQIGRKVNIPGPTTFALWPAQVATVLEGHQLKSNEYVRARIYNVEEAEKNWPADTGLPSLPKDIAVGKVIIVKGTDVNFFIPPTGVEVLPDPITKTQHVMQAVTLERLEYCLLLDENGNKRYERGPAVVFPTATEKFVAKQADSALPSSSGEGDSRRTVKLKAIELNDQMGLYIKVIADYDDEVDMGPAPRARKGEGEAVLGVDETTKDGRLIKLVHHKAGEELFIKGTDQRIYYPRPEHAIIEYGSEDGKFKRQRYYGIAIPKGEARYVLNKDNGEVRMERGPKVFLPDPRHEVIVRRILDKKTVGLWYPSNEEAAAYNENLATLTESSTNYVADMNYNAAMDLARSVNRGTRGTSALASPSSIVGDTMKRGTTFTPPPSLTLNTKYDGPPTISPWTGYAVQIVDKSGKRKVVRGPATHLLEYDESLERLVMSTGNPKNTDRLINDVYLRVDHNKVSDTIEVETKDMVTAKIKVSYRVNFEGDPEKWFAVENYVKFLTDHCRSLVRAKVKHLSIKELIDNSSQIVRDTLLGEAKDSKRPGRQFDENGMRIYDVEILRTEISDSTVASMIQNSQKKAVADTLELTSKQQELANTKVLQTIEQEIAELITATKQKKITLSRDLVKSEHQSELAAVNELAERRKFELDAQTSQQKQVTESETEVLNRKKAVDAANIALAEKETENFTKRMSSITDKLATAITSHANQTSLTTIAEAVAPIAIMEQQGVQTVLKRLFRGTVLEGKMDEILVSNGNSSK